MARCPDCFRAVIAVDPGQTITALITANSAGLQPRVQLSDPSSNSLGTATAPAAGKSAQCSSPHMIFCATSSSLDGISSGRIPICIEYSANRAERFADRSEAKVARASTRVPAAVASEAIVVQSVMAQGPIAL